MFQFYISTDDLPDNAMAQLAPVWDAVREAAIANEPGSVMAQLILDHGRILVRGQFIEREYGLRINKILGKMKAARSNDK